MGEKLPVYTKNQQIGNRSATILKSVMQKFCVFSDIEQSQDLGIDFIGTVINDSSPTEYNFNAQCKGTDNSEIKLNANGTAFSYPIKVSTINYWKQKKDVTFLFLVDERNEQIYWVSPLKEVENADLSAQNTYTFHIPKSNCLNRNSEMLPESFIFEIIRYYANFSETIIRQLNKVQYYSTNNNSIENMLELMEILEKNFNKVDEKYKETINKLIEKIKFDIERSIDYCYKLDQMDEVVRIYCPNGIFNTPFGTGKESKTIYEFKEKISALISRKDITYKELFELSKEAFELRGNYLGFLREMVYEDMPLSNHDDIEIELNEWMREAGEIYNKWNR